MHFSTHPFGRIRFERCDCTGLISSGGATTALPAIDAAKQPCLMCEDTPCVSACDTGALSPQHPTVIAEAHVVLDDCLADRGMICTVCTERCPVPGAMTSVKGRPRVNANACTGCGICLHVCPAPRKAILILPRRDRLHSGISA